MTLIRVFISIPVPDTAPLKGIIGDIKGMDGVRPSPENQMHLTMKFIGDVDDRKVPRIAEAVRKAVEGISPFEISLDGAGAFPNARDARVVWVGAKPADTLKRIADGIGDNLAGIKFDDKPFKSHMTVGRCSYKKDVSILVSKYKDVEFTRFECREVLVMRSELGPKGAKHTVLERVLLQ